jgi:deoxyribodipyrimidine photo-lyase
MNTAIWWIRRDLRIADNQALKTALNGAGQVLPVFVLDVKLLSSAYVGEKRLSFLFEGLRRLDEDLRMRGSYLALFHGEPCEVLGNLLRKAGADGIVAEADYSPYARWRDQRIVQTLPLHLTEGLTVHAPDKIVKADGTPYTVFTPYSKAWLSHPATGRPLTAPEHIPTPAGFHGDGIAALPKLVNVTPFQAGEAEAQRRLEAFSEAVIYRYGDERNRMDLHGTSGLSPYLRFGMLSARQALAAARQAEQMVVNGAGRRGVETWINELIWREFYIAILYHFPYVRQEAFRPAMRQIPWINNGQDFAAWAEGRTGYPVVDAAMRQLLLTGWMHNRARMITASFLTKDLLVDWRWGERHFMQHLVDGDPAANNGGWQWTAGTGTDAAPYFRVFNPVLQGMRFDPQGAYIRRYMLELANVPDEFIHRPWEMPAEIQKKSSCVIGKDYPEPMVDHQMARQRVLIAYKV